jgi:hypothetical protein
MLKLYGYLDNLEPTEKGMLRGLFTIENKIFKKSKTESVHTTSIKITKKGQIYFVRLFHEHYKLKFNKSDVVIYDTKSRPVSLECDFVLL